MIGIGISPLFKRGGASTNNLNPIVSNFLTATGITDATTITALNDLVNGLDSAGLTAKIPVLYPMVGGTSTTCRYNLMNPSTYLITYYGGWTFDATGATSNGTNAYGKTGINMNVFAAWNNNHLSQYIRNVPTVIINYSFGASDDFDTIVAPINLISYYTSNLKSYYSSGDPTYSNSCPAVNQGKKLTIGTCNGTNQIIYNNGTNIQSNANMGNPITSNELYFGATNGNNNPRYYTNQQYSFLSAGTYLNSTDVTNLTTLINNFQTALSRNV
jgi:hypothetical protein